MGSKRLPVAAAHVDARTAGALPRSSGPRVPFSMMSAPAPDPFDTLSDEQQDPRADPARSSRQRGCTEGDHHRGCREPNARDKNLHRSRHCLSTPTAGGASDYLSSTSASPSSRCGRVLQAHQNARVSRSRMRAMAEVLGLRRAGRQPRRDEGLSHQMRLSGCCREHGPHGSSRTCRRRKSPRGWKVGR